VSYLEWVQNRIGYYWPEQRVNDDLQRIMETAFDDVYTTMQRHRVSMRIAAFMVAIRRVPKRRRCAASTPEPRGGLAMAKPKHFNRLAKRYPEYLAAVEQLGESVKQAGPLEPRSPS
jgi:hypothetical protein